MQGTSIQLPWRKKVRTPGPCLYRTYDSVRRAERAMWPSSSLPNAILDVDGLVENPEIDSDGWYVINCVD